ncbi:Potassium channel AKT6 [Cytospora mali]|uniref:Potassium channel AKT6 n=1 Tax=Cytospora mali TaxID=578113 RepID=A0A194V372_CYTMA|nr:Potassium channel AKT6 [Valsa mali var. pyri (nom. inval.)]
MLLEKGADINTKDNEGKLLLSKVISGSHRSAVELLLEKGAKVDEDVAKLIREKGQEANLSEVNKDIIALIREKGQYVSLMDMDIL